MRDVVVVAGSVAQRPGRGGHAWVLLQYLLGFRRLGYDVLFLDRLSPAMLGPDESWPPGPANRCVSWLSDVMGAFGLEASFSLLLADDGGTVGVPRVQVLERLRESTFLLDVMGFLGDEELLAAASRRVFLDIDPGFPQMWRELGLHDAFGGHDAHATVGLRVGMDDSAVPTCGIDWFATPQPVVLDEWSPRSGGDAYTSVASWRGPFEPVDYRGERYGLRVHQLRRFAELPAATGLGLELALDIDPADAADATLLRDGGWQLVDPEQVAGTVASYRDYLRGSRGEVCVAKDMYVRSRGGWLSDRSLCYLASGKPVLAQATGFEREVPTGEGLLSFETPEQAAAGLEQIERRYERHCRAARELAVERFDSDRVLRRLAEAVA
jgi:hypothetical protein